MILWKAKNVCLPLSPCCSLPFVLAFQSFRESLGQKTPKTSSSQTIDQTSAVQPNYFLFFSIILSAITFFPFQFQPLSYSCLLHLPVVEKSVIHLSSLEMNAGKNGGMVLREETAQSYLQESPTWRTKQGTKLRRRPMVLERNRKHFVLFCFGFNGR